jgi:CDP-glucose 4,6-dehydratase
MVVATRFVGASAILPKHTAMNREFWQGRTVLVTGHTGFMGGWLSLLLRRLGADVTGYGLLPEGTPNLFEAAIVARHVRSVIGDLRDRARLGTVIEDIRPEVVFHLAAQPLVRRAHAEPVVTFETNVMGTVHLLEALRTIERLQTIVVVTTDKVYENREWVWSYRETDALGGKEPYGVSKACAELVIKAYWHSFFKPREQAIPIATARAGNIIGGGDWAVDRLVPDAMRAWSSGAPLRIRNPAAVRPWQHVVEPIRGYLILAERMIQDQRFAGAWNFGPLWEDAKPVCWMADRLRVLWGEGVRWEIEGGAQPYEARLLSLDSSRARTELDWDAAWPLDHALERTIAWYRQFYRGAAMNRITIDDIEDSIHAQRRP